MNADTPTIVVIGDVGAIRQSCLIPDLPHKDVEGLAFTEQGEALTAPAAAAAVAYNLRVLGHNVWLGSAAARDVVKNTLQEGLSQSGVGHFFAESQGSTPSRVVFRASDSASYVFSNGGRVQNDEELVRTINSLQQVTAQIPAIVVVDRGTGVVTRSVVESVLKLAQAKQVPVFIDAIDARGYDLSLYAGASVLVTSVQSGEHFLSTIVHPGLNPAFGKDSYHEVMVSQLHRQSGIGAVILLDDDYTGMYLEPAAASCSSLSPVMETPRQAHDRSGAPDAFMAGLISAFVKQQPFSRCIRNGSIAAAATMATHDATIPLPYYITMQMRDGGYTAKIQTPEHAVPMVKYYQENRERVVVMLGDFDQIDAYKIQQLRKAKARGERLIVGVRDDATVIEKTGQATVLNSSFRTSHVALLSLVDLVVLYEGSDATVLRKLKPDVFVATDSESLAVGDTMAEHGMLTVELPAQVYAS